MAGDGESKYSESQAEKVEIHRTKSSEVKSGDLAQQSMFYGRWSRSGNPKRTVLLEIKKDKPGDKPPMT